ncbi:gfo/Idh/MocA family oxidoreductase [candidate division KSB1 bacterium]|nr:Gfo/Idh/MocA family oxidoreductase [candidate division KSB1 bacterium]RQW00135.1 MAG: gfo/Idh/MocA family oxidoreductase [candidate division KSB1 bacterium]
MKRRTFIKTTLAAAPLFVPAHVLGGRYTAPSDKIRMGCIGVGSMGSGHVRAFLGQPDVQILAVCDVRQAHRERAKRAVDTVYDNSDCTTYHDFRELLARDDIDAIMTATPDNWHALIGLEAARRGVDMYFEKPLTMSINESQALRDAVSKYNVIFQFGTQQRSDYEFRQTIELIRNGRIGQLETVMIGSASYEQIPKQPEQPVPQGFDYDFWLGPAPWAPYTYERCTRQWTLIADYSLGCLSGAWGIHSVDMVQWVNRSDNATPVTAEGTGFVPTSGFYDTAQHFDIEHVYANGLKLIHMDMDTAKKRAWQFKLFHMAILFLGSEGWIYVGRGFMDAEPKSLLKEKLGPHDERLPFSNNHRRNFLDCVRDRKQPVSNIHSAFYSDVTCHQAHIAMTLGRKVTWNAEREEFENDPVANRLKGRAMRSPWHV